MEGAIFSLALDVAVTDLALNGVAAILHSRPFAGGRAKATYSDLVGCRL